MSEIADTLEDTRTASQLLAEARTAMGMSQEEVAQELYLIPSYIRHIDNDEIEKIDKQAFVRGYLRSYAKLVHLDGDDMVARYEKSQGAVPQTIEIRGVTQESVGSINFTGPVIQTGVLGLIGLIAVIAIVWFLVSTGDEDTAAPIEATAVPEVPTSQAPTESDPILNLQGQDASVDAQTKVTAEASAVQTSDQPISDDLAASVVDAAINEAPVESSIEDSEPEVIEANTAIDVSDVELNVPVVEQAETSKTISINRTEGIIRVDAGGEDELRFSFTDECWVEIEDADGNAIYGDLNRNGDELVVRGLAPFEVLFGKAPAVTMEFNGQAFDLRPHTTSVDTAKVRVP